MTANCFIRSSLVGLLTSAFLLLQAPDVRTQNEVVSLPLDSQAYREIIAARGKVPDAERLRQLIERFRGEAQIDRLDSAEVNGQRVLWVSQSPQKVGLRREIDRIRLEALRSITPDSLSAAARLDWRTLHELFELRSDDLSVDNEQVFPSFQRVSPFGTSLPDTPQTTSDFVDRLAWLRGVPVALAEIQQNLERGLSAGLVADRERVQSGIAEVRGAAPANPLESRHLRPFQSFPSSIPDTEQKRLLDEGLRIYNEVVLPGYRAYIRFLEEVYLPAARPTPSLASLPDGPARYASMVRRHTGLQISASELHGRGTSEIARLRGELDQLARESDFSGSGADFLAMVRKHPRCGALEVDAARGEFARLMQQVERGLPRLFTTNPKTPYEMESVPDLPFAFGGVAITRGSLKDGKPGRVRVKTPVENACSFLHLMLHEGLPGHLFQMHTADESSSISGLRRDWGGSLGYIEGWAEYASDLAPELGVDRDRYIRAERIAGKIFMAARAAVEAGIHLHGWTAENARAWYRGAAPWAPSAVVDAVVQAAFSAPGRQPAYMLGHHKILALRIQATQELGSRFDIRRFHEQVLERGPMPLAVLEHEIRDWVNVEKTRQ